MSIHDNWIYAHAVDHDSKTIVLHTMYPHGDSAEFTDVVFEGVLVHHFETQCMSNDATYPANVLFSIEEEDAMTTLGRYWEFISSKRKYGWPRGGWNTQEELATILSSQGHRCFHIQGAVGLDGFVLAQRIFNVIRNSKWTKTPNKT